MPKPLHQDAIAHLNAADPVMRQMIKRVGPCNLRPKRDRFRMLAESIISQQISTSAARSIKARLDELLHPTGLTPTYLSGFTPDELRVAGVSPQKAKYLLDLADKVNSGTVQLGRIGRYNDEKVTEQLICVKGIGKWTAKMFLMFALGRPDVFPHDDLGIRQAIRMGYGLDDLPNEQTSHEIAAPWRPYATVASWYCWRWLDQQKAKQLTEKQ